MRCADGAVAGRTPEPGSLDFLVDEVETDDGPMNFFTAFWNQTLEDRKELYAEVQADGGKRYNRM